MVAIETMGCTFPCWYWLPTGVDIHGRDQYTAGQQEVSVRWEKVNFQILDSKGVLVRVTDSIMSPIELPINTVILYGKPTLQDEPAVNRIPMYRIIGAKECPDIKGRGIQRTYYLAAVTVAQFPKTVDVVPEIP